jgi:hypothetical protein
VLLLLIVAPVTEAQVLRYDAEVGATVATEERQPFWLTANESGRFDPSSANGYTTLRGTLTDSLTENGSLTIGAEMLARQSENATVFLPEVYGQIDYRFARLRIGRKQEVLGDAYHSRLSTGSMNTSRNAVPIPMITLGTAGYVDVPFTDGLFQTRARWGEGTFFTERFVEDVRLHQKYLYLRAMPGSFTVAAGLVHNAMWAGTSPADGDLPDKLIDYWRAIYAARGGEEAPETEQINILGNHLGVWDFGVDYRRDDVVISVGHQHPYEDGSSWEKWLNVPDGIYSIEISRHSTSWLQVVRYEFLHTKDQSGSVHPPGRDDYYDNSVYTSGWTNGGQVMGNSLFLLRNQTGGLETERNIASNRFVAHHIGVEGQPLPSTEYRVLASWRRHYGRYRDPLPAPRSGWSGLLEVQTAPFSDLPLEFLGAIALDTGDIYGTGTNVGFRFGVSVGDALNWGK